MTKNQKQIVLLVVLLVIAVVVYLWSRSDVPGFQAVSEADTSRVTPIDVQAPDLRLDLLKAIQHEEYSGSNHDIFSMTAPPPSPNAGGKGLGPGPNRTAPITRPPGDPFPKPAPPQPPPPPVQVPAQFFGFETRHSGKKVAFFLNGEDVIVVAEGDPFLGNYRLIHIGNDSADVEEMSSGRHATVPLEKAPDTPNPGNEQ